MQAQHPPPPEEQSSPPPRPTRGQRVARVARRTARISAWGALALLVLVLLAAGGLWYWSAGDQSLNTTLHIVQRYMPAGSRFQAHGVRGTLRQGGHIDQLVYTQSGSQGPDSGALTLTLDNVDLQWDWTALRDRATRLRHLHAQRVTFADTRVADPHKAKEAFTSLVLPVGVDAPFVIDALDIVSKTGQTTTLAQLQGRYTYHRTTARHELKIDQATWNQGTYHINVALDGKTPMALDAQGGGVLAIAASGERPAQTLHLQAQAQGTLAEPEGELDVRAQVQPVSATPAADAASATRAELQATVQPWRSQPIAQAKAQWQQVNLQDFVPSLPRTQKFFRAILERH